MLRKPLRVLAALSFLSLLSCNFHESDKGKYYRAPQPTFENLVEINNRFRIKTIINLRGSHPGQYWYDDEAEFARSQGIKLIDIPMGASTIPSRRNLIKLLDALRDAERPILVHCRAGVDRTGEASALYAMLYMGQSKEQALEMLSGKYGHIEGIAPKAKRYFIGELWQGEEWARRHYHPCRANYLYFNKDQCDDKGNEIEVINDPNED